MTKEEWKKKKDSNKPKTIQTNETKKTFLEKIKGLFTVNNPSEKTLLKYKALKEKSLITIILFGLVIEFVFVYTILSKSNLLGEDKTDFEYVTKIEKKEGLKTEEEEKEITIIDLNEEITIKTFHKLERLLEEKKKDKNTKEIVILFNTPGGSPSASEEIYYYLKDYPKEITAYIQTIAASGGYYIASVLPKIYSNPNAIVGSIGVILPKYNFKDLAKSIGVEEDNITIGEYKSPISLLKPVTKEDKKYIKEHLMLPAYEVFLERVSQGRGIKKEELRKNYAEGQIWLANHTKIKDKLVDELTSLVELKKRISNKYNNNVYFKLYSLDKIYSKGGLFDTQINIESETFKEITKIR